MISFYAPKNSEITNAIIVKPQRKKQTINTVDGSEILFRGRKTISSHDSINCHYHHAPDCAQVRLEAQVCVLTGVGDSDAVWDRLNRLKIVSRHHGTSWQCRWGDIEEIRKRIGSFVEKEQVSPDRSVFGYSPCKLDKLQEATILTN